MKPFEICKEVVERTMERFPEGIVESWRLVEKPEGPHKLYILFTEEKKALASSVSLVVALYINGGIGSDDVLLSGHVDIDEFLDDMAGKLEGEHMHRKTIAVKKEVDPNAN